MLFRRLLSALLVCVCALATAQTIPGVEHRVQLQNHDLTKAEFKWKHVGLNPRGFDALLMQRYGDLRSGKLKAYEAKKPYDKQISPAALNRLLVDTVSIWDVDWETGEDMLITTVDEKLESDIQALTFSEEWQADFANRTFTKTIWGFLIHHRYVEPKEVKEVELDLLYMKLNPAAAQGGDNGEVVAFEIHTSCEVKTINHGMSLAKEYGKAIGKEEVEWEAIHFIERWYMNWGTQRMTKEVLSVWCTKGKMAGEVLHMNGHNTVLEAEDVSLANMQLAPLAYMTGSGLKHWKQNVVEVDSVEWKNFIGPAVLKGKDEWNFRAAPVFRYEPFENVQYTREEFRRVFVLVDSMELYIEDEYGEPIPTMTALVDSIAPEDINGVFADAGVMVNLVKGKFKVDVNYYSLTRCKPVDGPDYTQVHTLTSIVNDKLAPIKKPTTINIVRRHRIQPDIMYSPTREWKEDEVRYGEYVSYYETHWDAELRYRIVQTLLNAVLEGDVDIYPIEREEKSKKVKKKMLRSILEIPAPAVSEADKKMRLVNYHDVAWLNLHETWSIDHATGNLKIEVTGVEPEVRWKTGPDKWKNKKLFYMPLNGSID